MRTVLKNRLHAVLHRRGIMAPTADLFTKVDRASLGQQELDVGMAIESEMTLSNQERGMEWECRVIAVDKTGEGRASNTVMAVL